MEKYVPRRLRGLDSDDYKRAVAFIAEDSAHISVSALRHLYPKKSRRKTFPVQIFKDKIYDVLYVFPDLEEGEREPHRDVFHVQSPYAAYATNQGVFLEALVDIGVPPYKLYPIDLESYRNKRCIEVRGPSAPLKPISGVYRG